MSSYLGSEADEVECLSAGVELGDGMIWLRATEVNISSRDYTHELLEISGFPAVLYKLSAPSTICTPTPARYVKPFHNY